MHKIASIIDCFRRKQAANALEMLNLRKLFAKSLTKNEHTLGPHPANSNHLDPLYIVIAVKARATSIIDTNFIPQNL
jgi:hypothetical protein